MILLFDNFDSFTYNLADYFQQLGVSCKVVKNDVSLQEIKALQFDGIVLSPGPGRPESAGCLLDLIGQYFNKVPILGICLGHQALGEFFGGRVEKALKPMHGKLSEICCADQKDYLFQGLPACFQVVRYHSLVLRSLPDCLEGTAYTPEGELMAVRHKVYPIRGVQFHPEAVLTQHGLNLLRNWLSFNNIASAT